MRTPTPDAVRDAVARVPDPEIPATTVGDLGMIERIEITDGAVEVDLLPTFAGCPALDVIREDVERAVAEAAPGRAARVRFVMRPPWTTDRITAEGREALRAFGIAPPGERVLVPIGRPRPVPCPYCGAEATHEESAFGPTPCRAIRYCPGCRNPFEAFKPKV